MKDEVADWDWSRTPTMMEEALEEALRRAREECADWEATREREREEWILWNGNNDIIHHLSCGCFITSQTIVDSVCSVNGKLRHNDKCYCRNCNVQSLVVFRELR